MYDIHSATAWMMSKVGCKETTCRSGATVTAIFLTAGESAAHALCRCSALTGPAAAGTVPVQPLTLAKNA